MRSNAEESLQYARGLEDAANEAFEMLRSSEKATDDLLREIRETLESAQAATKECFRELARIRSELR